MRSVLRTSLGLLAGLLLALPSAASAQSLIIELEDVGSRDPGENEVNLTNIPIGKVECERGDVIDLEVRNIPTSASLLDFWSSTGPSCNETEQRSDMTQEGCEHLFDVATNGNQSIGDSSSDRGDPLEIPAYEFLPDGRSQCADLDQDLTIYILAASTSPATGDVGGSYGVLDVSFDTRPPIAPGSPEARNGEVNLGVKWKLSGTGTELLEHRIYVADSCGGGAADAGAMDAGATDAGAMDAGGDAAMDAGLDAGPADAGATDASVSTPDGGFPREEVPGSCEPIPGGSTLGDRYELVRCTEGTAESASLDAESLGVALGGSVEIAVTAIDHARNESEPAVVCVSRVDTTGYCESFGGEGCPDGCGCAAPGALPRSTAASGLALTAIMCLFLARRRRRG